MEIKIDSYEYRDCCDRVEKKLDGIEGNNISNLPNGASIVDEILEALGIKA